MDQPELLDWQPPPSAKFNGATYDAASDAKRLTGQIARVRACMIDGVWRTLSEIEAITGDPQASISAQLRNLKKSEFQNHGLEKRPRGDRSAGLWEYRLTAPASVSA